MIMSASSAPAFFKTEYAPFPVPPVAITSSKIKTLPLPYKSIYPENRYINEENNPPKVRVIFFDNLINLKNINCYSNEGNVWKKSEIKFTKKNELSIFLKEKFKSERGRINCSLLENDGKWRWLGIQYVIAKYQ